MQRWGALSRCQLLINPPHPECGIWFARYWKSTWERRLNQTARDIKVRMKIWIVYPGQSRFLNRGIRAANKWSQDLQCGIVCEGDYSVIVSTPEGLGHDGNKERWKEGVSAKDAEKHLAGWGYTGGAKVDKIFSRDVGNRHKLKQNIREKS